MNLIFAELFMSAIGISLDTISAYSYGWKMGETACGLIGLFWMTLSSVCVASLAIVSIQRKLCITMVRPHKLTLYNAAYAIAGIWFFSLGISLPPFFGFGTYYVPDTAGIT